MKKLKIYILALLVPILLMGCVEKGKPSIVEGIDGPNWTDLANQIGVGNEIASYSLETNLKDLDTLYKDTSGQITVTDKASIQELKSKLASIDSAIRSQSSGFNYLTSMNEVKQMDTNLTNNLKILNLSDLYLLKNELQSLYLSNTSDTFIENLNNATKNVYSVLDVTKSKNTFYAFTSRLYFYYTTWLSVSNQATLKNNYNLDVKAVNQKASVTVALSNIKEEIAYLQKLIDNKTPIDFKDTEGLKKALESLQNTYISYLSSTNTSTTFVNVSDKRYDLKVFEDVYFGPSSDLSIFEDAIEDLYPRLRDKSVGSQWQWKKTEILTEISKYREKLAIYTVENISYETIHSRIINLIKILAYLRDQNYYVRELWGLNPLY